MKKNISLIFCVLIFAMLLHGCGVNQPIEPLIDAMQFSNISSDELISIWGEPDRKDTWNSNIGYSGEEYIYIIDDIEYSFEFYEDKAVSLSIFTNQIRKDLDIGVKLGDDIFYRIGVPKPSNPTREISNSESIVWRPVNESIDQITAIKSLDESVDLSNPIAIIVFYDDSYYRD